MLCPLVPKLRLFQAPLLRGFLDEPVLIVTTAHIRQPSRAGRKEDYSLIYKREELIYYLANLYNILLIIVAEA